MSPTEATIWPMIAHVALVFALYVMLSSRRVGAVREGRARVEQLMTLDRTVAELQELYSRLGDKATIR